MSNEEKIHLNFDRSASVLGMMEWFAGQGIPVLPIFGITDGRCNCGRKNCESPGKHPISELVPNGVKNATTSLKKIRKWHRKRPDMNYAVATKGLAVIDCDSKAAIRNFCSRYRPPKTLVVKTARGSHFYLLGEMPARNAASDKLDVKSGPGCYVIGPGSTHVAGTVYAVWDDNPIADLPANISGITKRDDKKPEKVNSSSIPVGLRNDTLTKFGGYLRSKGVPQESILATLMTLNQSVSEKPLPDREIRNIARSLSRYPSKKLPMLIPFTDIPEENLDWLWYPYVCLGTLGLLDGDPGDGKSQFCVWLCSQVSRGKTLPNGDKVDPGDCFLFNFEDLPGAVIKRRLQANGADLSRIFIQSRRFQLSQEMVEWLDGELEAYDPKLVILDPIQAFITGNVDSNSNVDVREFMTRLVDIAEKHQCAIICVRHFSKGPQDKAMKKGMGSTDFVGIARNQFALARRNDDIRGFVVFHLKTNFEKGEAMLFKMGDANGRLGEQPTIAFDQFTNVDADLFFSGGSSSRGPDQEERQVAKDYLLETLANGSKAASLVKSQAEARAITASTLDRARKEMNISTVRNGKTWVWSLPPK